MGWPFIGGYTTGSPKHEPVDPCSTRLNRLNTKHSRLTERVGQIITDMAKLLGTDDAFTDLHTHLVAALADAPTPDTEAVSNYEDDGRYYEDAV